MQDSAVIGIPDERSGELPRAYVVLKNGREANEQELQEFIKGGFIHVVEVFVNKFVFKSRNISAFANRRNRDQLPALIHLTKVK